MGVDRAPQPTDGIDRGDAGPMGRKVHEQAAEADEEKRREKEAEQVTFAVGGERGRPRDPGEQIAVPTALAARGAGLQPGEFVGGDLPPVRLVPLPRRGEIGVRPGPALVHEQIDEEVNERDQKQERGGGGDRREDRPPLGEGAGDQVFFGQPEGRRTHGDPRRFEPEWAAIGPKLHL